MSDDWFLNQVSGECHFPFLNGSLLFAEQIKIRTKILSSICMLWPRFSGAFLFIACLIFHFLIVSIFK